MTTAFYLFSNLFHIYAMYLFSNVFFDKKNINKALEILLYGVYYSLNSCAFLLYHNWLLTLLSNLLPFLGITFLYKSQISKKITATVAIYIVAMACDIFVMAIQNLLGINSMFFSEGFVSNIVFLTAINFITHFFFKKENVYAKLSIMYYITFLFVPLGSIIIGYFVAVNLNAVSLISSVILFLINADIFYLYDSLIAMLSQKHENKLIEQQNEAYQNQLNLMQQSQLTIRCLKHDMDNHILKMQDLLNKADYEQLKTYLSDTRAYIDIESKIIDSGNETVDSILNYKLPKLNSMNVEKNYKITLPQSLWVSSFDMNIVLGNLIDNSIEALAQLPVDEYKKFKINISYQQGYIRIIIGNTFDGVVIEGKRTNKKDNLNHGIGLKSVEKAVEKYGGLLKTEISDKWFEASVILYEK